MGSQVLFISGRAGVGKTSALLELHEQLARDDVKHAVLDGDWFDQAHPAPWEHNLEQRNLAAVWGNYRELGYERLGYAQTVAVPQADSLAAAMGDDPQIFKVLLTVSEDASLARLRSREVGQTLDEHLVRSRRAAAELDARCGPEVHRIDTTGLDAAQVAARLREITGW